MHFRDHYETVFFHSLSHSFIRSFTHLFIEKHKVRNSKTGNACSETKGYKHLKQPTT